MSTTAVIEPAEDWPDIPERDGYEYVDGKLVRLAVGAGSTHVAYRLVGRVNRFAEPLSLGWALAPETAFQIWPTHPRKYRKPDGSFLRGDPFPDGQVPEGFVHVVPALVIEVVSPRDVVEALELKVVEYFEAGVALVWVLHPKTKSITVYRPDGSATRLTAAETLSGEDVLPGFRAPVGELFDRRLLKRGAA